MTEDIKDDVKQQSAGATPADTAERPSNIPSDEMTRLTNRSSTR